MSSYGPRQMSGWFQKWKVLGQLTEEPWLSNGCLHKMGLYWLHAHKRFDFPNNLTIAAKLVSREYFDSQRMIFLIVLRYDL